MHLRAKRSKAMTLLLVGNKSALSYNQPITERFNYALVQNWNGVGRKWLRHNYG